MTKELIMYKYSDELFALDKELNKYNKRIEKFNLRKAIKLVRRVRSGISIKDEKLFFNLQDMDQYIFIKWLNEIPIFSWAIFRSIKRYHSEINNIKLFVKFHEDMRLDKKF